jgi:hypothetical protein
MGTTYRNLRAELWYKAKAWFEARDCRIPNDEELVAELATVRYFFSSSGKMQVEGKEIMTYRGIPIREVDALVNTETLVS